MALLSMHRGGGITAHGVWQPQLLFVCLLTLSYLQELALTFDPETSVGDLDWSALALGVPEGCTLVTVNGVWQPQLSSGFEGLPPNLIVGPISQLSDDVIQSAVAPALGR